MHDVEQHVVSPALGAAHARPAPHWLHSLSPNSSLRLSFSALSPFQNDKAWTEAALTQPSMPDTQF